MAPANPHLIFKQHTFLTSSILLLGAIILADLLFR